MTSLIALGINHETADVAVREQVAFAPEQMVKALRSLLQQKGLEEAMIVSTCNRTEIIANVECLKAGEQEILHWLASYHNLKTEALHGGYYSYTDKNALLHIMQMACGLDSMVLGEPQILGQLKSAFAVGLEAETVSGFLQRVMQHTFLYAKKVRNQTAIGQNPVSVAFAAVHLAQKIFSDLSTSKALLIGAGETIDLVARHLLDKNIGQIIVANRTLAKAESLAEQYQAEAILLSDIPARLADVDMVISSTASQLPILGKGAVEQAIKKRKHRPMFMFDIAVPRDIEPEVADLKDVYLYTVDDLKDMIDENKRARLDEAAKADVILQEGVEHFQKIQRGLDVVPLLKAYREQAQEARDDALEKAMRQLSRGVEPEEVLQNMARLLTNKLTHTPSINLKKAAELDKQQHVQHFAETFELAPKSDDGQNE